MSANQLIDPRNPRFTIVREYEAWCRLDNPYLEQNPNVPKTPYLLVAGMAPSARAKCGKCSDKIEKGTVRVGMPYQWRGAFFSYVTGWYHADCVRFEGVTQEEVRARTYWKGEKEHLAQVMKGKNTHVEKLGKTQRVKTNVEFIKDETVRDELMRTLTSASKPKCEEDEVDPNEGTFLKRGEIQPAEPPRGLVRSLLPFQKEGLAWMMENEKTQVKGGILADEMGMGKTIQAVSLVLKSKEARLDRMRESGVMETDGDEKGAEVDLNVEDEPKAKNSKRSKKGSPKSGGEEHVSSATKMSATNAHDASSSSSKNKNTTLIVVPTSALVQWEDEIKLCTKENALKVFVYYNDRKRKTIVEEMRAADVVLTTFPVLEAEYRKCEMQSKVPCAHCFKLFLPRSLAVHNKYFCGPDAKRTQKLEKTEKTREVANTKALATLNVISKDKLKETLENLNSGSGREEKKKSGGKSLMAIARGYMQQGGRDMSMYDGAHKARAAAAEGLVLGSNEDEEAITEEELKAIQPKVTKIVEMGFGFPRNMIEKAIVDSGGDVDVAVNALMDSPKPKTTMKSKGYKMEVMDDKETEVICLDCDSDEEEEDATVVAPTTRSTRSTSKNPPAAKEKKKKKATSAAAKKTKKKSKSAKKKKKKGSDDDDDSDFKMEPEEEEEEEEEDDDDDGTETEEEIVITKVTPPKIKRDRENDTNSEDNSLLFGNTDDRDIKELLLQTSSLHQIHWERIILDEAHKIKARTTSTAKAVYALDSDYKWCLTGTPLQNRVGDLYSLVRFLQMEPYSFYFCTAKVGTKDGSKEGLCGCKSACWDMGPNNAFCVQCGHAPLKHFSKFNKDVINPIQRYGGVGAGKRAYMTLRNDILLPAMLRRTKKERAADVVLPPLTENVLEPEFDQTERDFYEALYANVTARFDGFVKKGTVLNNYAHVFELLSRLRQACDHPYLVLHSRNPKLRNQQAEMKFEKKDEDDEEEEEEEEEYTKSKKKTKKKQEYEVRENVPSDAKETMHYCGMPDCGEKVEPEDAATSKCKHIFHRECIQPYLEIDFGADGIKCPKCRTNLTIDLFPDAEAIDKIKAPKDERGGGVKKKGKGELDADDVVPNKSILNQIDLSEYRTSSKIEKMMEKLREIRSGRDGKKNKAIIFSQYTSMIDIVEWRMRKENFVIRKLVGSMPVTARAQNLHEFCTDPDVDAIIMSLKSGGEGLNLQAANYVFVLEPWWNPAVEMQAVMRAHRIGQTREVTAFRFACKDTIESKMHELQKLKRLVFEGTMDGNEASMAKLSPEDLQFLFKR